jgi:hypothetical protein
MNQKERMRQDYPYKGISDKKYIKDKKELFKKHGNGWWYLQGLYGKSKDMLKTLNLIEKQ